MKKCVSAQIDNFKFRALHIFSIILKGLYEKTVVEVNQLAKAKNESYIHTRKSEVKHPRPWLL